MGNCLKSKSKLHSAGSNEEKKKQQLKQQQHIEFSLINEQQRILSANKSHALAKQYTKAACVFGTSTSPSAPTSAPNNNNTETPGHEERQRLAKLIAAANSNSTAQTTATTATSTSNSISTSSSLAAAAAASNTTSSSATSSSMSSPLSSALAYVALYDYDGRTSQDLSLRKGDTVYISDEDKDPNGWWLARRHPKPFYNNNNSSERTSGYIPSQYVARVGSLEAQAWYFGAIKRMEAEKLLMLEHNRVGSFLVRLSEASATATGHQAHSAHAYSLSVRDHESVKHYRIRLTDATTTPATDDSSSTSHHAATTPQRYYYIAKKVIERCLTILNLFDF